MIDVYNNAGTESYGCFKHLKAAKPTLKRLGEAGVQSVTEIGRASCRERV